MPTLKDLVCGKAGEIYYLLGNDAAARGVIESGVQCVFGYPGTPSSEILDDLVDIFNDKELGPKSGILHAEYSTNEAVAAGAAVAAAHSNMRSFTTMKMVGLNVASDILASASIFEVDGGMVVYIGDDPNCHSSQNQLDTRRILKNIFIPVFEPSDPDETKKLVIEAFTLSHKYHQICSVRTTTRVAHQRGNVKFGPIVSDKIKEVYAEDLENIRFKYNPQRKVAISSYVRENYPLMFERLENIQKFVEKQAFEQGINKIIKGEESFGIITSGVSYDYVKEACYNLLNKKPHIMKLGITNPLPVKKIKKFSKNLEKIVVVEELEPFLEEQVCGIVDIPVLGKDSFVYKGKEYFPRSGELTPGLVAKGLAEILNERFDIEKIEIDTKIPKRRPRFCPGCPHTATYYILGKVFERKNTIYLQDIGCYTLGTFLDFADLKICMGGSVNTLSGFQMIKDKDIVALVGDSTFLHAAIPGLINAVSNKHKGLVVILDNKITAMTGHQPRADVSIVDGVKGCGVRNLYIIDPYKIEESIKIMEEAKEKSKEEITVIISERECILDVQRKKRRKGELIQKYTINQEKCKTCGVCYKQFGCSAISKVKDYPEIDSYKCSGCGVCFGGLCKPGAIEKILKTEGK